MALFAPSASAALKPSKDLQQPAGPSSPSAASAKENEDGQVPHSAPDALKKGLRRFSPARPVTASERAPPAAARSAVDAGAVVLFNAGKERTSVFEKARNVLIASHAIEKLAEVVSGKAPVNPARRTPLPDAGAAAAPTAADTESPGAPESLRAAEGQRRFIPAGPRQATGGSVFFAQQSPESRTARRNSYVASTFSSPLLLLSPGASGSGAAGGAGSPPSTRRDNLLEAPTEETAQRKALLPSEWGSPVAATGSRESAQTDPARVGVAAAETAAAVASAAAAAVSRTAAAVTAEAAATKGAALSVATAAVGDEGVPQPEGGGASPGNAIQGKRRRAGAASFATTAARRFWLSSQQQQQQQQQKSSAEAPPGDTAAQSPAVPCASQRARASLQQSEPTIATAAAAAPEAAVSATIDPAVEQRDGSASRTHGAKRKNSDSHSSGVSLDQSASSNSSLDLRALRRQCYRADAGPLLQSVTSLPSANKRSSRRRRSKSPALIPTAANSPTLGGVGSSKAPSAAAAAENEAAATATPASGKEQQQQEQQLSPRSRAHQQLSSLLLHGQLLQQEQQLRSPLLLYPPQQQEQPQEEKQQDDEALLDEGEVGDAHSHMALAADSLRAGREGNPAKLLGTFRIDRAAMHADAVSSSPSASEAARTTTDALLTQAEVSKTAAIVADAASTAAAGAARDAAAAPAAAQMATGTLQGVRARPSGIASSASSGGSVAVHADAYCEEEPMWSHVEAHSQRPLLRAREAADPRPCVATATVDSERHTESTVGPTQSAATSVVGAAVVAAGGGQGTAQRAAALKPAAPSTAAAIAAPARIATSSLSTTTAAQTAANAIAAVSTAAAVSATAATAEASVLAATGKSAAAEAASTAAAPTRASPPAPQWPASVDSLPETPGEIPRAPPASPSSRIDSPTGSTHEFQHQHQQRTHQQQQQRVRQEQLGQTETQVSHGERVETESQGRGQQQRQQLQIHAPEASHQQRLQPRAERQQQQPQQTRQPQQQSQDQHKPQQQPQQQQQPLQQPQRKQQQLPEEEHQQQSGPTEGQSAKQHNEDLQSTQLQQQRHQREQRQQRQPIQPIQQQPEQQRRQQQQPRQQQAQRQQPQQQALHQQQPEQEQPHEPRPQQQQLRHRSSQEDQPLQQPPQHQKPQQLQHQQQQLHRQRAQPLQQQQDQPQQQVLHPQQTPQQQTQQQQPQQDQSPSQKLQQQKSQQQQQQPQQREGQQVLQQHVALLRSTPLAEPLGASQPSELSPRRGRRHSESGTSPAPELAAAHARQSQQQHQQQHFREHQHPQQQQPQQHLQQSTEEGAVRREGRSNLGRLEPVPPPLRPSRLVSTAADANVLRTHFPLLGHASSSSSSSSGWPKTAESAELHPEATGDLSASCVADNTTAASSAGFLAVSRNPSGGAQRPVVAPAPIDLVRKQQQQQAHQQHLRLEQHELPDSVASPTSELRASSDYSFGGRVVPVPERPESLRPPPVSPVVPDTAPAAAVAADLKLSQARAQQPQQQQHLLQHVLQRGLADIEAADSEASPVREEASRQSADSGFFGGPVTSPEKEWASRSAHAQAEAAPDSPRGYADMEARERQQLLHRDAPPLRRGRSPDSSTRKRPRRISSPPPSAFTATSSSSNFSSSSPWVAAAAGIASKGRRAASAGLRRLYSAARVRLRRLSQGASKWAGALVASALLAAAGPLNSRLVGQLARALPPAFTKLPDFARRELGACEVRRSPSCSRISPRILASRPTLSEAQQALRIAAAAEAAGEALEGVEWCIVQLAAPAQAWLTVLGCSERLRAHHNFFSVECGGYALTHLRLGVRSPQSAPAGSPGQAPATPRTVVLRLRVYGQVALGPPPPALEASRASNQHQQECWPPGVIEDVTNMLHGAAVVAGPSGGVWTPQTKQELLLPRSSLRSRNRTSSRSCCSDASSRYSSSSSRHSNGSVSVGAAGNKGGDYGEVRPVCEGPEVWVVRLSSRCCLRRVDFTRQPNSEEADEGVVYELHGLEAPRELTNLTLPQEIREMQELDELPWQPLARAEIPPDDMHPTLSLAWDDPARGDAGKPPAVTHVRVVCSRGSDLRRLAMWGVRLPLRASQGC